MSSNLNKHDNTHKIKNLFVIYLFTMIIYEIMADLHLIQSISYALNNLFKIGILKVHQLVNSNLKCKL